MSESPEQTKLTRSGSIRCFKCGQYAPLDTKECPTCGNPFAPRTLAADDLTEPVAASKTLSLKPPAEEATVNLKFRPDASVILQFLPTGACLSLTLDQPMILGRGVSPEATKLVDLTEFQGLLHGVSRQHCKLERRGERLYAADLGSTNGTYHNDERLQPFKDQPIGHGDRLILGALHVLIRFSKRD